jgi:hypothetical protein
MGKVQLKMVNTFKLGFYTIWSHHSQKGMDNNRYVLYPELQQECRWQDTALIQAL